MKIIDHLYPDHPPFEFSNGWFEAFKVRHGIKKHHKFGESGSVDMTTVATALSGIRQVLDAYEWCDIYNMDESGLFYRMQVHTVSSKRYQMSLSLANYACSPTLQADNSLATKQLEGRKQSKERLTLALCCNGDGSNKLPLWVIGKFKNDGEDSGSHPPPEHDHFLPASEHDLKDSTVQCRHHPQLQGLLLSPLQPCSSPTH
jgi:hypothetical protein